MDLPQYPASAVSRFQSANAGTRRRTAAAGREQRKGLTLIVPQQLALHCSTSVERRLWLAQLPQRIDELASRWALDVQSPFDSEETRSAWVAPVTRVDGSSFVLKITLPHMEGRHEIDGLRFWNGDPTVRVIEADDRLGAILLERCVPGTVLRTVPEPEQDVVIARLLQRLWRAPSWPHPFRPLSELTAVWADETRAAALEWPDDGLVRAGLELFHQLPRTADAQVLLATDLHAGNVLRAEREPWLVIDPKPFVGDPAYDATQHLLNCMGRLSTDPDRTIAGFAELLGVDRERVRLWMFARAAAEPRDDWHDVERLTLARTLAS